ncbi:MAG: glycosyltransferase [Actinomycetota bacterium]|nr:glycosyltransferase [Actinomycetota bacterium]
MRILLWHVHGSWTTSFVQGGHEYVLPVDAERGPDGRGRAQTWDWPDSVTEASAEDLAGLDVDVVLLQRPHEEDLVREWLGRRPGYDVPAVYLEHNTPGGHAPATRHPYADQQAIPIVHVTAFNRLFWDCGSAPTTVIEHGVVDPGHRYVGDEPRAAVVLNDPIRRGRAVGTDLLSAMSGAVPLDVFGMGVDGLAAHLGLPERRMRTFENLSQADLHQALGRRRLYLHTTRWTSLGLSLLEAMHLGLPIVALATTEVVSAVPAGAGVVSTRPEALAEAARRFLIRPHEARMAGMAAREAALERYGLKRFLDDWDRCLTALVS